MASLKILEEILMAHDHRFEFKHFDGAESIFGCTVPGCKEECVEPEDSGTGA